ncbi:MAG TPA: cytochrome c3 family protein [Kofleriaceae bacterium]|nr:cytochrome c3 family protein [Kofleriaceae bacterium]
MRRLAAVALWICASAAASVYLALSLDGDGRHIYLPGETTSGHHQIEERCELCHSAGDGVRQDACLGCHREELAEADDSHAPSLFLDPRNAAMSRRIDARRCVTCHLEHRPGQTAAMGVSMPADFCADCHQDIASERPSHAGMPFDGCAAAGCHNYHDNRGLAEQYLAEHLHEPALAARPSVPAVTPTARTGAPLSRRDADGPPGSTTAAVLEDWSASSHARAGVSCTACHGGARLAGAGAARAWTDRPGPDACAGCHGSEVAGFQSGKHGMRLAAGLGPMTPSQARLPMVDDAAHRELGCASCHGAHSFDTREAAVEACLGCHADQHSLAYLGSPHERRWRAEQGGAFWPGSGVSCATCHLPRVRRVDGGEPRVTVDHDQNAALRPVETMVRAVCASCHGVDFSLASLADPALVGRNFRSAPAAPSAAMELVRRRGSDRKETPP